MNVSYPVQQALFNTFLYTDKPLIVSFTGHDNKLSPIVLQKTNGNGTDQTVTVSNPDHVSMLS